MRQGKTGGDIELSGSAGGWATDLWEKTTHTHTPALRSQGLWPGLGGSRGLHGARGEAARLSASSHLSPHPSVPSVLSQLRGMLDSGALPLPL